MKPKKSLLVLTYIFVLSLLTPLTLTPKAQAVVNSTIANVYLDIPLVQGSYAVSHGGLTETFDSSAYATPSPGVGYYIVPSGTALNFGSGSTVGTTSGEFRVYQGGDYGASSTSDSQTVGGTASAFGQIPSGTLTINFQNAVKYIGFHWQAGDGGNQVTFMRNGNDVATVTTSNIKSKVDWNRGTSYAANSETITTSSGVSYLKKHYWGNPKNYSTLSPTSAGFPDEPFAYVHAFAANGQAFDAIRFQQSGAGSFEFDNMTVSTQDVPIRDALIFSQSVSSSCTVTSNNDGNGVTTLRYQGTSLCTFTPPSGVTTIKIYAVAGGGGGGGGCVGGGGGAGGYFQNLNFSVTGNIDMLIGAGGSPGSVAGGCVSSPGEDGGNTTITSGGTTTTLTGGGGGGAFDGAKAGRNGGSGGGGSGDGAPGAINAAGTGVATQGNPGGVGRGLAPANPGGGGGGYSSAGDSGTASSGGAGGAGITVNIFGGNQNFAGGGGGASDSGGGSGGQSCGGTGAHAGVSNATAATGFGCGGGGGSSPTEATAGSAGVVFISYVRVTSITWSISGTTGSGPLTEISWTSMVATTRPTISIKRTLVSEATSRTPGTALLLQAPLDDSNGVSCGTYSTSISTTIIDSSSVTINVTESGSYSASSLVRGYCYRWTEDPAQSSGGLNAVAPTDSDGSLFTTNLTSPVLVLPLRPSIRIPSLIPANPRNRSVYFPTTKVGSGASRFQACFFENDGSSLNGSVGTPAGTQNLTFTSGGTTATTFTGTSLSNSLNIFNSLRINRTNDSRFSVDRYVLVRLAPYLGGSFTTDCVGSQSGSSATFSSNLFPTASDDYLIRLKPINLTQTRTLYVPLKNGRQP